MIVINWFFMCVEGSICEELKHCIRGRGYESSV